MTIYNNDVCFLSEDTNVLTNLGYKNIDDLTLEDKLISTNNKVSDIVDIVYKRFSKEDVAYSINFSNGERVLAHENQKWRVKYGDKSVIYNSQKIFESYSREKKVFLFSPKYIDFCDNEKSIISYISKTDLNARALLKRYEFSHAIALITKAYCVAVNSTPLDSFPLAIKEGVRLEIEKRYGKEVFKTIENGTLPQWFFHIPLADRYVVSGILLDELKAFDFEQTSSRTYASLLVNEFFVDDISQILTSVGCTKEVSAQPYTDNISSFCINENVKYMSLSMLKTFPGSDKFEGSYVISVDNMQAVYPGDLGVEGFYEVRIKPKTRGLILGNAPIMTMPT